MQYLQQVGVDKKTIDNLIKKYTDKVVPDPVKPGDDTSKSIGYKRLFLCIADHPPAVAVGCRRQPSG